MGHRSSIPWPEHRLASPGSVWPESHAGLASPASHCKVTAGFMGLVPEGQFVAVVVLLKRNLELFILYKDRAD